MGAATDMNIGEKSSSPNLSDNEAATKPEVLPGDSGLERNLTSRHLQFIAIGATIGTGLFIGTSDALADAGPASMIIAYVFVGTIMYSIMSSLGEMAAYMPVAGSFTAYASRFVDPSLGFSMSWIYWFSWAITFALELTVAGIIIQYWLPNLSVAVWISVFWVMFTGINLMPVKWFGEIEMWLSMIKVITIVGFIIFGICMNAGVGDEGYIGFKYYHNPGAFAPLKVSGGVGKFVGFWSTIVAAGFSYQGMELVGVGAGETANPRKAIPRAIRWTFWGVTTLFVLTVFFIGINVPYNDPSLSIGGNNANGSPLVIAAKRCGVPALAHVINAVLLTAVLSAANSNVYSCSRIMVGMAEEGFAPMWVARTNRWGTPYVGVAICSAFGLLAFMNLSASGETVFQWFRNISAVAVFIVWGLLSYCHIRLQKILKVQGVNRLEFPYTAPWQPWLSWYGFFWNAVITITSGFTAFIKGEDGKKFDTNAFFSAYVSLILFVVIYAVHKLVYRTRVVPMHEVDLSGGRIG